VPEILPVHVPAQCVKFESTSLYKVSSTEGHILHLTSAQTYVPNDKSKHRYNGVLVVANNLS